MGEVAAIIRKENPRVKGERIDELAEQAINEAHAWFHRASLTSGFLSFYCFLEAEEKEVDSQLQLTA